MTCWARNRFSPRSEKKASNWTRVKRSVRALRRLGSAALDLAYVADGRFDGFAPLTAGENELEVTAVLADGSPASARRRVYYEKPEIGRAHV